MSSHAHHGPIGRAGPASGPDTLLGRRIPPTKGDYRWVYLWGLPIRSMHWLAAGSILVLVLTGLYIYEPFGILGTALGGQPGHLMATMRHLHFLAAVVLVTTGLVRIYWLFAGNRFERLKALFPLRGRDLKNLWKMIKYYLFLARRGETPEYLGHNPLQQLGYTFVYVVTLLAVLTGFIMFGQALPTGTIYRLTDWMLPVFGGIQNIRLIHHAATWFFIIFVLVHVYLTLRGDRLKGGGLLSSIITGGRYFRPDREYEDDES